MCKSLNLLFLSLSADMATNNQLPVFWSSWLQFPVQYDFSVSSQFLVSLHVACLHTLCFTCAFRDDVAAGVQVLMMKSAVFLCTFP